MILTNQISIITQQVADRLSRLGVVVVGFGNKDPVTSMTVNGSPICLRQSYCVLEKVCEKAVVEIVETATDATLSLAASSAHGDPFDVSVDVCWISRFDDTHGDTGFFQCRIHGFSPQKEPHATTT